MYCYVLGTIYFWVYSCISSVSGRVSEPGKLLYFMVAPHAVLDYLGILLGLFLVLC